MAEWLLIKYQYLYQHLCAIIVYDPSVTLEIYLRRLTAPRYSGNTSVEFANCALKVSQGVFNSTGYNIKLLYYQTRLGA